MQQFVGCGICQSYFMSSELSQSAEKEAPEASGISCGLHTACELVFRRLENERQCATTVMSHHLASTCRALEPCIEVGLLLCIWPNQIPSRGGGSMANPVMMMLNLNRMELGCLPQLWIRLSVLLFDPCTGSLRFSFDPSAGSFPQPFP